jgi:hypothetical protein
MKLRYVELPPRLWFYRVNQLFHFHLTDTTNTML